MLTINCNLRSADTFLFIALYCGALNAPDHSWQLHARNSLFASVQDIAIDQSSGTVYVLPYSENLIFYRGIRRRCRGDENGDRVQISHSREEGFLQAMKAI